MVESGFESAAALSRARRRETARSMLERVNALLEILPAKAFLALERLTSTQSGGDSELELLFALSELDSESIMEKS